jgi:hypothetical protein
MLNPYTMGQQMLDFYQTTFDHSYNAMLKLTELTQHLGAVYWQQRVDFAFEAKKGLMEVIQSQKKQYETFKKVVDDGFKKLETLTA